MRLHIAMKTGLLYGAGKLGHMAVAVHLAIKHLCVCTDEGYSRRPAEALPGVDWAWMDCQHVNAMMPYFNSEASGKRG